MMQANIQNRTVFTGDCLDVMRGMDTQSVNLIYLDPPFNSKKQWDAPIGSTAEGASFKDYWTYDDVKREWRQLIRDRHPALQAVIAAAGMTGGAPDQAYLCYMGIRMLEMHRILKNNGSIYLHCDPTMSHSLKLLMDAVFGADNFRNEIIWFYPHMSAARRHFPKKHDALLFYTRGDSYTFNGDDVREEYDETTVRRYRKDVVFPGGYKAKMNPKGRLPYSVWQIPPIRNVSKERLGYPTQKPLALLGRIVAASSNTGDVVLDPFCGCGTACDAAEQLGRKWIGIDVSAKAAAIIKTRLPLAKGDIVVRTEPPERTGASAKFELVAETDTKTLLYGRQGGICAGCDIGFPKRNLQIDHNISRAMGGGDELENLQLLCQPCNASKGAKRTLAQLRAHNRKTGILPPLEDG